jgi:hypothetical protein
MSEEQKRNNEPLESPGSEPEIGNQRENDFKIYVDLWSN